MIVVAGNVDFAVGIKLPVCAGDRHQVARIERHDRRPAGKFMQRGSGRVALGDEQRVWLRQIADHVVSALDPTAFIELLEPIGPDALEAP